jgi:hypothetical protein
VQKTKKRNKNKFYQEPDMKKIFSLIVIISLLLPSIIATDDPTGGLDPETLQNDKVVKGVQQLQNFTEKEKLEYLSEQWKELLLKERHIASIDSFLQKFDWAFLFLFGREYELSLVLFFAVLIWIASFIALPKYFTFLKEPWMRYAAGFAGAVILAQLQIFNAIANFLISIYFYRYEWWWKIIAFVVLVAGLVAYYKFLKYFSNIIEARKKKKAEKQAEEDKKDVNKVAEALRDASQENVGGDGV